MPTSKRFALVAVSILLAVAGCSDAPPTVPVSGKVVYQDEPLRFGTVMFQHVSGGQPSRGKIQPDGTYELSTFELGDGARVGPNLVRITSFSGNDPAKQPSQSELPDGEQTLGKSLIPRRYNSFGSSRLKVDVAANGPQKFDFELDD